MHIKIKFLCLAALCASALSLAAAPLTQPLPVLAEPKEDAPVITELPAGTEPPSTATDAEAPEGWRAVALPGPHEIFVDNGDIGKQLDVKPGSPMRTEPNDSAPVLAVAKVGDKTEITGLRGKWTQLRLNSPIIGYVRANDAGTATNQAVAAAKSEPAPPAPVPAATYSAPPPPPPADDQAQSGPARHTGPRETASQDDEPMRARLFEGTFVSTRAAFRPRRPFDFAINSSNGTRIAYVDLSKLMLTEQIENYLGLTVVVYGTARPVEGTDDIVVQVESLRLR